MGRGARRRHWLWQETGGCCVYCGEQTPHEARTSDHVVPRVNGGSSGRPNLVPACRTCNSRRDLHWPPSDLAHDRWKDYVKGKEKTQGFLMANVPKTRLK